jgi:hypothetical protein
MKLLAALFLMHSAPPQASMIERVNMNCGFAPFPPMGCRVGPCVCDQYGRNCQWTFICR